MSETAKRYSVLVVEASRELNAQLCGALERIGNGTLETIGVADFAQAREAIAEEAPDFIVPHLQQHDGSCEELMGYLVSTDLYRTSRVIVRAGATDAERRDRLFRLGVIDVIGGEPPLNVLANEIIQCISGFSERGNIRILVAGASRIAAEHTATVLRNQNYRVEVSAEPGAVYETLRREPFGLLLCEVSAAGFDGTALMQRIRSDDALLDLPVIGLSGEANREAVSRFLKSGANDSIAGPVLIEHLLLKIAVTAALHDRHRRLGELNAYLSDEVNRRIEEIRDKDRLLELENRHAQMGEMVAALVHQWKQPLNVIATAAEYIGLIVPRESEEVQMVGTIRQQVRFLAKTMDTFRDFFKPVHTMESFDLFEACEQLLKLLEMSYAGLDVTLEGVRDSRIRGNVIEFQQILVNLLNNAQDAFVETKRPDPRVAITIVREGENARLRICDNAGGIPESVMERLFDRYVSTKGNKGTGIGLNLSRSIAQKMGGEMRVENRDGGACFEIVLPLEAGSVS